MTPRNFILATAGHVDHGKSSLVKALTGIDPDRLPEEKARGITIDLGFAHLEIPGFHLGIIDVPGHEDFVKNMVSGVGATDLALLAVAADDGWMPQTEEHLQILSYLGVTRAVVALTKIDLAVDEAAAAAQVREKLENSPFSGAPIVPVSIHSGRGIDELKSAFAQVLADAPPPRDIGKPRLPVDRVFMLRGIGLVVTGTLIDGPLSRGQNVLVHPAGKWARIRSLQNHHRDVEVSVPGMRAALSLSDPEIRRGDVITGMDQGRAGKLLDVLLEKSARLARLQTPGARPLKDGARVRVHLGSTDVPAQLCLMGNGALEAGGRCLAQLRLERPVFALAGDRFIVRDGSEQATLAGGVVLDADPVREKFRSEARRRFLEARGHAGLPALVATEVERLRAVRGSGLLLKARFSALEISEALSQLAAEKRLILTGAWALDLPMWERLCQTAAASIDTAHQARPERPGLPLADLRSSLQKDLPSPEVFDLLTAHLYRSGFAQAESAIQRKAYQIVLPPHMEAAGAKVRQVLAAHPLDPPSRKEIAPDTSSQQALRYLIQTGEAIELAPDVVISAEGFRLAIKTVKLFLRIRDSATPSELRVALRTSRRILIPLLERLDREGLTGREGDRRVLRRNAPSKT